MRRTHSGEYGVAAVILVFVGVGLFRLVHGGYLPQPMYFHPDETLMDLHSTAYWANTLGAYALWHSIYPPLSFAILKLISIHNCYGIDGLAGRGCDWRSQAVLGLFFIINIGVIFFSFRRADPKTALPRTIALSLGLPMLYALERGNLLIFCFLGYALASGGLLRGERARWVAMAWAINMKPYVLIPALSRLVTRDLGWFVGCGACALAIYLTSYMFYGSGSIAQILIHEGRYATAPAIRYFSDLYYATSYWPLIRILQAAPPGLILMPHPWAQGVALALQMLIRAAQAGAALCFAAAVARPARVDVPLFGALFTALALTAFTSGSAGYTQVFLFLLIFLEPARDPVRLIMLVCVYLLCVPADIVLLPVVHGPVFSFLGGRRVVADFGVSLGQLARPALLLAIQFALILLNLRNSFGATPGSRASTDGHIAAPLPSG